MNCPRHEDICAYLDHMLPPAERAGFAQHLDTCPLCRERVDALAALAAQLRELPSPPLGFDLAAQWDDRLRGGATRMRPSRRPGWNWGWGGAAVALSLAAGVWLGGLLIGGAAVAPPAGAARVFDPVPPGGLCAAPELCRLKKGMP